MVAGIGIKSYWILFRINDFLRFLNGENGDFKWRKIDLLLK